MILKIVIMMVLILFVILSYNKEEFNIPVPMCRNCGSLDERQCSECENCVSCLTPSKTIQCTEGNASGPLFRRDCVSWNHGFSSRVSVSDTEPIVTPGAIYNEAPELLSEPIIDPSIIYTYPTVVYTNNVPYKRNYYRDYRTRDLKHRRFKDRKISNIMKERELKEREKYLRDKERIQRPDRKPQDKYKDKKNIKNKTYRSKPSQIKRKLEQERRK